MEPRDLRDQLDQLELLVQQEWLEAHQTLELQDNRARPELLVPQGQVGAKEILEMWAQLACKEQQVWLELV